MMNKDEFYIEEYKTLKAELLALTDESVKLETFGVAAVAALYAWLASQHIARCLVWFVPVLIPVFGWFRSRLLLRRIDHMSEYIREQIEKKHDCPGWESFFHSDPKSKISRSVDALWLILGFVTILAPFVLGPFALWHCP
jgi:hypothetical protein